MVTAKAMPTDVRHFTRQRTLTFPILISFCLNLVKGSLQAELNTYFQHKNHERVPQRRVSASAFCKARHKFSETAFIALNHQVTQQFYQQNPSLNWKGFRVFAVDGSQYLLPNTPTAISLQTAQKGALARLKTRKLAYKINFAHALSMMKNTWIHLCFDSLNLTEIAQWLHVIGQSVNAIRPDRHFTRKKKVTDRHKHHMAYKRAL